MTSSLPTFHNVPVCGEMIPVAKTADGQCYFSPRHVCEKLGIDWASQFTKIKADRVLSTSVVEITTQLPGANQSRTYSMLPITLIAGWLFTIKKVRPEVQLTLDLFRVEAFGVLDAWFRGRMRDNPVVQEQLPQDFATALEALAVKVRENAELAPKAQVYDARIANKVETVATVARTFTGVNTQQTKADLLREKFLYRQHGSTYRVYSQYRETLFAEKQNRQYGYWEIIVLPKGKEKMADLYRKGKLTMKKGFEDAWKKEVIEYFEGENYEG